MEGGKVEEEEKDLKSSSFTNPKAPEHFKIPNFAIPLTKSSKGNVASGALSKIVMTPRTVTTSMRAFSSVVYIAKTLK